ncbi:ATP-binding protein [Cupriavidus gilardii]|uniref:ATP-binding protein n=1 Tax=Cupriavidus gilardii TaxID=82541 RepID=A0ABY4VVB6_9BURK|nr:ATP-binding protein [Cupriavidus gilardii]USE80915.1 ATP-binding protein [Cupriavidus gilardii]
MKLTDLWHFPRPQLARSYLAALNAGILASLTIFAPRRTGKTVFLRHDLTPAAEKDGYLVVYVDLWQTRQTPGAALLHALETAKTSRTFAGRLKAKLSPSIKSIKGRASVGAGSVEGTIEWGDEKGRLAVDMALRLDDLLGRLTSDSQVLLLIDEAQSLGRSEEGEDLARALRTALTKYNKRLRVVFTGSSRTQLGHVFTDTRAPLYSAGHPLQDFPLLDDDFVEFVAKQFAASTGRTFDLKKAKAAFKQFHQRPEPLLEVAVTLMMQPKMSFAKAVALQLEKLALAENHEATWAKLTALERLLVAEFANNPAVKPFARSLLAAFREQLGIEVLGAAHVQKALARLDEKGVVSKSPRGSYEFENENFGAWVRNLADAP